MSFWQQSIEVIPGISTQGKASFAKLNIHHLYDLIWHLPMGYEDRRLKKITELKSNFYDHSPRLIRGKITARNFIQSKKKYWRLCLKDDSGQIDILLFNLPYYLSQKITVGTHLECFGSVFFAGNKLAMMHPKFRILGEEPLQFFTQPSHYQAVYPTTQSLSQLKIQKAIAYCLNQLITHPIEDELDSQFPQLPQISESLLFVHQPPIDLDPENMGATKPIKRLVVHELAQLVISSKLAKMERKHSKAVAFSSDLRLQQWMKQLEQSLSFKLNQEQIDSIQEVQTDLAQTMPMQRLIQGDVGTGKTIVSAFCALAVLNLGYQVALLAPTEVLAKQHADNFRKWYEPLGIEVHYLSRQIAKKERAEIEHQLNQDKPLILIGTHVIFQKEIELAKLGLVMIDEPQRFGVIQRLNLLQKGQNCHQLLLSATPIPRTLAQSLYADLDISQIKNKPHQKQTIKTILFNREKISQLIERVNLLLAKGDQVFWVCPRIDYDEQSHLISSQEVLDELSQSIPYPIAMLHGKLKSEEKNQILEDFRSQKIKLLVSTTVIEVGVDCPNATVMVIENAANMGLSTLHQLRGRVGRGEKAGFCVLLYDGYLSQSQLARLEKVKNTEDGFEIAKYDLETRGAGDLFGTAQTGSKIWQFFRLPEDEFWLNQTQTVCELWIQKDTKSAQNYLHKISNHDLLSIHQVK